MTQASQLTDKIAGADLSSPMVGLEPSSGQGDFNGCLKPIELVAAILALLAL